MARILKIWCASWMSDRKFLVWLLVLPILFTYALYSLQSWSVQISQLAGPSFENTYWESEGLFRSGSLFHTIFGFLVLQRCSDERSQGWFGFLRAQGVGRNDLILVPVLWALFGLLYSSITIIIASFFLKSSMLGAFTHWAQHIIHGLLWFSFAIVLATFKSSRKNLWYLLWPSCIEPFLAMILSVIIQMDISNYRMFSVVSEFGVMRNDTIVLTSFLWAFAYFGVMWSRVVYSIKKDEL